MTTTSAPLLTLNCHEAWVHQLGHLGFPTFIIDGLPGRYTSRWDTHVRPVPERATLVTLEEALAQRRSYHCIIAHNISDLMSIKLLDAPRILVIHGTLEGRLAQEGRDRLPDGFLSSVRTYVRQLGVHVVAVSALKARSWRLPANIIPFAVSPETYLPWSGQVPAGIRVANQIHQKARVLRFDLHEAAFAGLPVRLVGHNPGIDGAAPSESWDDLKLLLSRHRFFVHTADPEMEDGYNMATLEAMAAGLPVLGNVHPSSPIEHGVSGFLSDDPKELRGYAELLLADQELAGRMGQAARLLVTQRFPMEDFVDRFHKAIETARAGWLEARRRQDRGAARA